MTVSTEAKIQWIPRFPGECEADTTYAELTKIKETLPPNSWPLSQAKDKRVGGRKKIEEDVSLERVIASLLVPWVPCDPRALGKMPQ